MEKSFVIITGTGKNKTVWIGKGKSVIDFMEQVLETPKNEPKQPKMVG